MYKESPKESSINSFDLRISWKTEAIPWKLLLLNRVVKGRAAAGRAGPRAWLVLKHKGPPFVSKNLKIFEKIFLSKKWLFLLPFNFFVILTTKYHFTSE